MKIAYNITLDNLLDASGGKAVITGDGTNPLVFNEIFTDSRDGFGKNSIFIALKGKRFNGEDYVSEVLGKGAACAVVSWDFLDSSDLSVFKDKIIIAVSDTVDALGGIAKMYMEFFKLKKKIAITGSCGKTTTKEMLYKILAGKFGDDRVLKNDLNFNNRIGVPLAILGLKKEHDFIILEIGSNKKGEIEKLAGIISPDIGVITNIGKSHLSEFKDLKGVLTEKLSMYKNIGGSPGIAVINRDDKLLAKANINNSRLDIYSFGILKGETVAKEKGKADFVCENIKIENGSTSLDVEFSGKRHKAETHLKGEHLIYDFICAISAAYACGVDIDFSIKSLSAFNLPSGRMQAVYGSREGYTLINDSYNSNPDSLKAALNSIKTYYPGKKIILVLGDMLELGESSESEHFKAGIESSGVADYIFYKGYYYNNFREGLKKGGFDTGKLFFFDDPGLFTEKFSLLDKKDSVVLLKGSRGMKLENYFSELKGAQIC